MSQQHARRRWTRAAWTVGLLVILLCAIAAFTWLGRPSENQANAAPPADLATLEAVERGFTWIAETVKPAVVFIEVEQKVLRQGAEEEDPGVFGLPDRWWREFFGPDAPVPRGRPRRVPRVPPIGQGSGVIIDPAGYIVTNNHVVGEAAKVTVHLADGSSYTAEVVGADRLTDLAVIKIEPDQGLTAAKLGDADAAKPGSWAMAIGYPFGGTRDMDSGGIVSGRFDKALTFEPTITVGVVSATNRQLQSDIPGRPFRDLIQTDAPINPGSSGGPLVNVRGEVIGVNQAIFTSAPWGGNIGVGFAIPINAQTKRVIEALKGGKPVVRGQLGVLVSPLTPTLKSVYGAEDGVFVEEVQPDTPASRGGLKGEDVIVKYDGKRVTSVDQFVGMVQTTEPEKTVSIDVIRDGKPTRVEVTIEALTLDVAAREPTREESNRLGLTVETLPQEDAEDMGLAGGVRVLSVDPLSDGARAGLRPGDVIVKINRERVADVGSYKRVVESLKRGDPVAIRVWRADRIHTAQIERLSE